MLKVHGVISSKLWRIFKPKMLYPAKLSINCDGDGKIKVFRYAEAQNSISYAPFLRKLLDKQRSKPRGKEFTG